MVGCLVYLKVYLCLPTSNIIHLHFNKSSVVAMKMPYNNQLMKILEMAFKTIINILIYM